MALILKDRVKESSTSSGTGNITLGGAFPGYQTFSTAIASGSTVYYTIHNLAAGFDTEWEVGVGTFTSPATLSRDTVISSSTGSLINFTAGTGGLEVFVTQPAEQAVYLNQATGLVEIGGNGTNVVAFTEINTTNLTANTVTLTAGTISTAPSNATDIVNKTYVDEVAEGLLAKPAVEIATTGNLSANYDNGASGVGATLTATSDGAFPEIDGVTLTSTTPGENGVLVKNQSSALQNGRYNLTTVGDNDNPWVLTRCGLCDESDEIAGSYMFVKQGTLYAGTGWVLTVADPDTFVIGTDAIIPVQFSGAGTYTAGTGLTLSNGTVFSITNTAVTPATYGDGGNVAQVTVNAQGQLTNAANVAINASSITVGTLSNDRTTANSANGASTIVARDTNGSFTANVINATDVNSTNVSATTGSFTNISGNAATVTSINASNISSGTIDNARTTGNTANSASTIVLRDASGNFGSNVITASSFSGDGTAITAINASNISSGTIANARTTAASANGASTIVQRDAGGNFSANTITANISGNGAAITDINASNITSGTISNARTTASSANGASTIVLRDANGDFSTDAVTANFFIGDGSNVSSINASNLASGTVNTARVSGSYTGITGVGTVTAGTWQGNSISTTYTDAKVTAVNAGTGISVNQTTGSLTVTNSGVTSLAAGTGISVSGSTGGVTVTNGGVTSITGGTGVTANVSTGSVGLSIGQAVATSSNVQFNSLGINTAASGTAGEIRATNNITAYYSDERLKTKVGNIENALDKLCQIETMLYHANETAVSLGYDASVVEPGVTAQSVQKVQPEVVVPAPIDAQYLTVRYEKLVPLIIEAIKELKAEVATLRSK